MEGTIDSGVVSKVVFIFLVVLCLGPIFFPLPVAIIRGKAFGFLKTIREELFDGTDINNMWINFASRLEYEGFKIEEKGFPHQLTAKRVSQTNTSNDPTRSFGHARQPMRATITFAPEGNATRMRMQLQYADLILIDTGEGEYIRLLADRLVNADLATTERPVVLNPSYQINFGYYSSIVMCATALAIPFLNPSIASGLLIAYAVELPVIWCMAILGYITVTRHPKEMSGKEKVPRTLAISLLALVLAFGLGWYRHGDAIQAHLKAEREKAQARREMRLF